MELKEDLTISPPYRMGAVYMNVGNMRMGQDSEYFRHGIQDRWAHDMKFPLNTQQPGFPMLSNGYNNYIQFQTSNPFTLW